MSRIFRYIKCFFIIFLYCNFSYSQKAGGIFHHLTAANGLSSNRVIVVMQDSRGFYWIGTEDGLNRFDGSTCKVFRNIKNDSTSISNNSCTNILEDGNGDIWIATHMGINRYDYKTGKFERFFIHHPTIGFDRINVIRGLQKDEKGNLWIASSGLWRYNIQSRQWKSFIHDSTNLHSIPEGVIWNLRFNKTKNVLWMRTFDEYAMFDPVAEKFYTKNNSRTTMPIFKLNGSAPFEIDANNKLWFNDDNAQLSSYDLVKNTILTSSYKIYKGYFAMSSDAESRIWIHYWYGETDLFNTRTQKIDSFFLADLHPQSALSTKAQNIYIDSSGINWISSLEGISIYNPKEQAVRYFLLPNRRTLEGEDNRIYCMAEQDENTVWLGTNTGLCKYDLSENKFRFLDHLPFEKQIIKCLYKQNNSTLWVGTAGYITLIDIQNEKVIKELTPSMHTEFITEDYEGNIWVGTLHNGLYKFSSSGELLKYFGMAQNSSATIVYNNMIGYLANSSRNQLWIGYSGERGFSQLEYKTNKFLHYKIETGLPFFRAINTVNCLIEENGGNLWIGSSGGGLVYFDRKKDTFTVYSQSDGLKSDYINAILPDLSGRLWVATSNGLSIININTREITNPSIDLELKSNSFFPNGLLRKDKKMLFFADRKLIEVDPEQMRENNYPSKILFSSFKVFDKESPLSEKPDNFSSSLSYRQNFFSIEYSLLSPDPNNNTQYTYRLEGFDQGWMPAKERRVAYYTNVPPGSYTFQVKAIDATGKTYFSKPILISISTPFWKTWWFTTLAGVVLLAGLYFIYRFRLNQVKKVYSLRSKISQDLHDEIGATLSSIHVYSSVAVKAIDRNPERSLDALQHINENTRQVMENMNDIVWAINASNSGETSLEGKLKNYGYELLTPLNIQCIYWIDKETDRRLVNMEARKNILLIIKEAMNNIAKYSDATEAMVKLEFSGKNLSLEIADNGKGLNPTDRRSGNGMYNMKQRTESLGGEFQVSSWKDKGTSVHCSIPITNISD